MEREAKRVQSIGNIRTGPTQNQRKLDQNQGKV